MKLKIRKTVSRASGDVVLALVCDYSPGVAAQVCGPPDTWAPADPAEFEFLSVKTLEMRGEDEDESDLGISAEDFFTDEEMYEIEETLNQAYLDELEARMVR